MHFMKILMFPPIFHSNSDRRMMRTISWLGDSPAGTWMTKSIIWLCGGNLNYDNLKITSDVTSPGVREKEPVVHSQCIEPY